MRSDGRPPGVCRINYLPRSMDTLLSMSAHMHITTNQGWSSQLETALSYFITSPVPDWGKSLYVTTERVKSIMSLTCFCYMSLLINQWDSNTPCCGVFIVLQVITGHKEIVQCTGVSTVQWVIPCSQDYHAFLAIFPSWCQLVVWRNIAGTRPVTA